jgi:hypothetical protein
VRHPVLGLFKKEYGNAAQRDYANWFLPFAREVHRLLRDDGSFVIDIADTHPAAVRFGRWVSACFLAREGQRG